MEKKRILMETDDPDTLFSYGLQTKLMLDGLKDKYDFHIISNQWTHGMPHNREGWWRWACEGNSQHRDLNTLPNVIGQVDPMLVFTLGDIQHFEYVPYRKPPHIPWVAWFPWDNADDRALQSFIHILRTIDVKVAISKFQTDFLRKRGVVVHETIYNIVDTDVFKPMAQKETDLFYSLNPGLNDKKILLFVGRPNWRKRISHILCIFEKLLHKRDDIILYLHVNFRDACSENDLVELLHGLDIYDQVAITRQEQWTLGIASEFLNKLYNVADLYITPHGGEGFGLPIAEAMACKTPFVATNYTTTPEFAGENEERGIGVSIDKYVMQRNIMRPYVNIKEFVNKVDEILDDDDRRKKMGIAGRKWVLKNCSKPVIVKKFKRFFDSLDIPMCRIEYEKMVKFKKPIKKTKFKESTKMEEWKNV